MPDRETEFLLIQIFGRHSYPMLKFLRMKLWLTRFKNINPYPVPRDLPQDPLDLAKLSLRHMEPNLSAKVTVYQVCIPVGSCSYHPWLGSPSLMVLMLVTFLITTVGPELVHLAVTETSCVRCICPFLYNNLDEVTAGCV